MPQDHTTEFTKLRSALANAVRWGHTEEAARIRLELRKAYARELMTKGALIMAEAERGEQP